MTAPMSQPPSRWPSIPDWLSGTGAPGPGRRSPPIWQPNGSIVIPPAAMVGGSGYVNVLGARPGRVTAIISNIGANTALIHNTQNPQTVGATLGAGGVWTLDTEGEWWVYSAAGTTIDVVETAWALDSASISPGGPLPDISGALK